MLTMAVRISVTVSKAEGSFFIVSISTGALPLSSPNPFTAPLVLVFEVS